MDFTIIVTFGPSIQNAERLQEIDALGRCIYRINGAHTNPEDLTDTANFIRDAIPSAPIMLDLPGNKVRLIKLPGEVSITKDETIEIHGDQLNYPDYAKHLKIGDCALTHDSKYTLEVSKIDGLAITFISHQTGVLIPNKGLHVQGANNTLPFLFERDRALIEALKLAPIEYLSLSFVRNAEDIKETKTLLSDLDIDVKLISKIETGLATQNLGEIFYEVDIVNVDRGDLSADVGIMSLPLVQERIIESAKRANKQIFLATQFLHNMETHSVPLISEITDLYKTIKTGVSGLQLSEETAVGRYPVECVKLVFDMYKKSFSSA